ncbi:unnamed protein product, partial [Schistosoma turkestanicum]
SSVGVNDYEEDTNDAHALTTPSMKSSRQAPTRPPKRISAGTKPISKKTVSPKPTLSSSGSDNACKFN